MVALVGCTFPDVVELGSHDVEAPRAGGPTSQVPPSSSPGLGGGSSWMPAGTSGAAGETPVAGCNVPAAIAQSWAVTTTSDTEIEDGIGGVVVPGQYRLERIVEQGCVCFDTEGRFSQTLLLEATGAGSVVARSDRAAHLAATFTFETAGNAIAVRPTCSEYSGAGLDLFGPFDSYSAADDRLSLVSEACRYRAEYRLDGLPAR